jgi:glutamate synthase domain-containing protein 1
MCGIIAVLLADPSAAVNQEIYDGLTSLQHRGQDAAGMSVCMCVCLLSCPPQIQWEKISTASSSLVDSPLQPSLI